MPKQNFFMGNTSSFNPNQFNDEFNDLRTSLSVSSIIFNS